MRPTPQPLETARARTEKRQRERGGGGGKNGAVESGLGAGPDGHATCEQEQRHAACECRLLGVEAGDEGYAEPDLCRGSRPRQNWHERRGRPGVQLGSVLRECAKVPQAMFRAPGGPQRPKRSPTAVGNVTPSASRSKTGVSRWTLRMSQPAGGEARPRRASFPANDALPAEGQPTFNNAEQPTGRRPPPRGARPAARE